jgi:hypothetical protein
VSYPLPRGGTDGTSPRRSEGPFLHFFIPSIRKRPIVKHNFHLPALARGIVVAAVLASFAAIASIRAYAQVTVYSTQSGGYYNPYGQSPYAGYGQAYANSPRARGDMFQNHGQMVGNKPNGYSGNGNYSGYGNVPSGYGNRVDYGNGSYVRTYGGTSYYRPYNGPVYVPFGY